MAQTKAITGVASYKTEVTIADYSFVSDEPLEKGGSGAGPTPTQLLAASLAACTSITLRMYANRKEIAISKIEVNVGFKVDLDTNETYLVRDIILTGNYAPEQKQRLLQIATLCPVSKLLSNQTKIITEIL